MKTTGVTSLAITATAECEEPIAALLERLFTVAPSIYSDAETSQSTITAYLRATPRQIRTREAEIHAGLDDLRQFGLDLGAAEIVIAPVKKEDWAESWKKHFKPLAIGSSLLIKPSWSKQKARPGQAVVILDPGLSFGTGQHATTSFCLRQLALLGRGGQRGQRGQRKQNARPRSLLDIGCGSGILAIAAAKLGYAPVEAFDFDPVAVKVALKNGRINRVEKKIALTRKDLAKLPLDSRRKYDVICANLISPLLIAERARILNRLAPGGALILAGILAHEFPAVQKAFEKSGLKLTSTRLEREWQSGAFHLPPDAQPPLSKPA